MRILENWQSQMRSHLLQKMLKQLDVRRNPVPFAEAKSVGILFDATDSQTRDQIVSYVERLNRNKPYTASVGYFDSKQDASLFSFKAFNKNDLDWLGRPKANIIETYANRPFDYLICIYENTCLPIEYLAALSNAHFRVGPYTQNTYCYDLIIDTKDKGIKHYLKEVDFYLNKVIQTHEPQFIQRNRSSVGHSDEGRQG